MIKEDNDDNSSYPFIQLASNDYIERLMERIRLINSIG